MKKIILFSLCFSLLACSQKNQYPNGYYEDGYFYFYNGDLGEGELLDGEKEGFWQHWDNQRKLHSEGSYRNNQMHGDWVYWYPNGEKLSEGRRYLGNRIDQWTFWYPNGQVMEIRDYKKEGFNLLISSWDSNGNPMVVEGKGPYFHFSNRGILREEGFYLNGLQDSIWNFYDQNGNFDATIIFKEGRKL